MRVTGPDRRAVLLGAGAAAFFAGRAGAQPLDPAALNPALPAGTRAEAELAALPGKRKLIKLSWRPPNYESPLDSFADPVTANDRFFVRYHLAGVPSEADLAGWSLSIGGEAAQRPVTLTLDDLRAMQPAEVMAVCQCSGNRRGLFSPHVPGVQWGVGAMGNALWRGVRLRDVLAQAGIKPGAIEVAFRGADAPVIAATPPFRKSLPLDRALDDSVLLAWSMNAAPLPLWNGYPVRLVVPGWTGTYWMKHVTRIELLSKPLDSFWMQKAYRVPRGLFPAERPFTTQETEKTSPITDIVVNALITAPADGATVQAGSGVQGLAWDSGHGIARVDISLDDGGTWTAATLGADLGRYAFRPWSFTLPAGVAGRTTVQARATSLNGATQPATLVPNPAGYQHNVIAAVTMMVI